MHHKNLEGTESYLKSKIYQTTSPRNVWYEKHNEFFFKFYGQEAHWHRDGNETSPFL
jgi:hypothetical protein